MPKIKTTLRDEISILKEMVRTLNVEWFASGAASGHVPHGPEPGTPREIGNYSRMRNSSDTRGSKNSPKMSGREKDKRKWRPKRHPSQSKSTFQK